MAPVDPEARFEMGVVNATNTLCPLRRWSMLKNKRGDTPEGIVRSFRTLQLADVYAVISRYLANPARFDEYLGRCDEEAEAVRRELEAAGMTGGVGKEELLTRARAKGLIP